MLGLQYKGIVVKQNLIEEAKIYFVQSMDWVRVTGNSKILIFQNMTIP